jgi:hypothetical protein
MNTIGYLHEVTDDELTKEQCLDLMRSQRKMLYRYVRELGLYDALSEWVKKNCVDAPVELLYVYERSQNFDEDPRNIKPTVVYPS